MATELSITSAVKFRPIVDIRVEGIALQEANNGATIKYEPNTWQPDWNVADTITGFTLPNADSSLTYEVTVTNYGNVDQCIYSTSINDETVNYQITGYTIKDIITPGETKTFTLTFTPVTPSSENKDVVVHYEFRKVYRIEYNANGGSSAPSMQRKYERENLTLTSELPVYTGHIFLGWSTVSSDSSVQYQPGGVFTLDQDTILYAKWQTTKVSIKMDMNGGSLSGNKGANVTNNGSLVLVDNSDIIHELNYGTSLPQDGLMDYNDPLNINIEKTGYVAKTNEEWNTTADGTGTSFNQSTVYQAADLTSDTSQDTVVTLYVNWVPINYSLTYELNGGSLEQGVSNPSTYNIETADFTLNNPSKEGSVFLGWIENEQDTPTTTKTITQGTTGNKTLTAVFEQVQAPTITHTPTTWTNQDVTVTITSDHNDYTYMYKIDNGSFTPYNAPFTVSQNCTITAYSIDSNHNSANTTHDVTNIDKIDPTMGSLSSSLIETDSFRISGTAQDQESGIKELKIYKDNTYVASLNYVDGNGDGTTSLIDYYYDFSSLEPGTTYTIRVDGYDVAGNMTSTTAIDVTTSEQIIIVARLIGYNGVDYNYQDEEDYITFPTLKSALEYNKDGINCLTNQCKIQMLDSVIETNNILGGQDIILDLNGYTINGVRNYTFTVNSNAEFTVIDSASFDPEQETFNEATHNCIKNTTGTAIINNGTLTLGSGTTGEDVSIYLPYIYGATEGVNTTNGTFNFYDGRIKATTAINGEVSNTPTLYNASIEIVTESSVNVQVATLRILSEVEARIGSKYYTRVGLAVDAVEDSYYEDILTTENVMDALGDDMGFEKVGNFLVSKCTTPSCSSSSYVIIDLRDKEEDQILTVSTNKTRNASSTSSNTGYVVVFQGTSGSGTPVANFSIDYGETTNFARLPKGSLYYIALSYYTDSSEQYPEDAKMYITGMTLKDAEKEIPSPYADMDTTDISHNYGFDYDPVTRSYKSNNQYTSNTTAFSYYEIDLTNESTNKILTVSATLSANGSHYGFVDVKTDNTKNDSNYYNALIGIYASSNSAYHYGPIVASQELQAGQKYYVQFYYKKYSDSIPQSAYEGMGIKDQFIINSIDVVDAGVKWETSLNLSNMLITPGDYGFTANSYTYANSTETTHSFVPIDLRNTSTDTYAELDFYSYYGFYTIVTDSPELPTDYTNSAYHNPIEGPSYYGPVTFNLVPNQINYIHFIMPPSSNGTTQLKTLKLCGGKSYSLLDIKRSKGVSYGFENYYTGGNFSIYPNGSVADSYTEIDLRNNSTDVLLSVDAQLSSSYMSYMYVSENNVAIDNGNLYNPARYDITENLLLKYSYSNGTTYMNGSSNNHYYYSKTYNYVLSKGKKYYLHFGANNTNMKIYKIITRNIGSYDIKIGKTTYVDNSQAQPPVEVVVDEDDDSLRFIGSNPNNYVSFNNELWRMVGVFDTEDANGVTKPRIKLIKNDYIGSYSYDSSVSDNNALGINEWSQSDLMKLLNPGYSNNQEETFALVTPPSSDTKYSHTSNIDDTGYKSGSYSASLATKDVVTISGAANLHVELRYGTESNWDYLYVFQGTYTGNVSRNMSAGQKYTYNGGNNSYRTASFDIVGDTVTFAFYSDGSGQYYGYYAVVTEKTTPVMTSQGVNLVNNSLYWDRSSGNCFNTTNNRTQSCSFTSNGINDAYKDYIDTVVWNTGAIPSTISSLTNAELYSYERGSNTGKTSYTSQGAVDDTVTRTSTWLGKIGLPYPSDYKYNTSWISTLGNNIWFMNPVYNSTLDKVAKGTNSVGFDSASTSYYIRPALYLSTKVQIDSGEGSSSNPYILSLGQTDNEDMNNYYGLNPEEEEPEDTGQAIEYSTTDYMNIRQDTVYGFVYDENNNWYVNNNTTVNNTLASSYIVIDRTSELESIPINITTFRSSMSDSGLIVIMEDNFDSNVNIDNSSSYSMYKYIYPGTTRSTEMITLEAGKKYYIYMMFKKYDSSGSAMVVKIEGLADTPATSNVTRYNGQNFIELQETVQILKDITLSDTLTIPDTKSVVLDLNGYTLTSTSSNPVITNNGILEIEDTKDNGGTVVSTTGTTILNNPNATLNIVSGLVDNKADNISYSAVDNYGKFTMEEDGQVRNMRNTYYAVKNESTGDILNGSGTIIYGLIYNISNTDTGFGGYHLDSYATGISNVSSLAVTLNNLTGSGRIYHTGSSTLNINNSTFGTLYPCGTSSISTRYVTTNVNNSSGSIENGISSQMNSSSNGSVINVTNHSGGNITMYTGTINISDSTVGSITNYQNLYLDDSTAEILSNPNSYSNAYIRGESVVGTFGSSGYANGVSNAGSLTVGVNDETVSTTYPKIGGVTRGVNNTGTFSFYDGQIVGAEGTAIVGPISAIATGKSLVSTVSNNKETITLETRNVCEINGVGYPSIQDAIDSVSVTTETEIDIIEDLDEATQITVPANRNIKIDYNDHTINVYKANWITNNGSLTLYDSQNELSRTQTVYPASFITNNGRLDMKNISMDVKDTTTNGNNITNAGTVTMDGTKIYTNNSGQTLIYNSGSVVIDDCDLKGYNIINNTGSLTSATINGGTFNLLKVNSTNYAGIKNNGTLTIYDGTFNSSTSGLYDYYYAVYNTSTANILGGTYGSYMYILNNNGGTGTIRNVTSTGIGQICNNVSGATVNIDNVNISFYQNAVTSIENAGTVTVSNSNILGVARTTNSSSMTITNSTFKTSSSGAIIYAIGSSSLLINSGTINNTIANSYNGINVTGTASLTIKSGTVKAGSTGIYNSSTGVVTIGEYGGRVSADDPNIKGGTYGIRSTNANAQVYFYDGMFTGSTNNSINSTITAQEPNYDIITITNQDGSESKYLSNDVLVRNLDTLEDYSTLSEALSEASSGDTLQLLRDLVTTSSFTTLTIPSNMSITIDMNNHVINQNGSTGSFIENNGTLTFIDSYYVSNNSSSSSIRNNTTNTTITNNGTLITNYFKGEARVSGSTIINNTSTGTLTAGNLNMVDESSNTLLLNNGTATINSGIVTASTSTTSSIVNNDTLTINNITYTGSNMINNTDTLTMNGGVHNYSATIPISIDNSGTANISSNSNTLTLAKINNSGTLNMSGGSTEQITTTGEVYVTGGTVSSTDVGIKIQTGGRLQLGTKDGTTNNSTPVVRSTGGKAGITGSNFYFYDGIVSGSRFPISCTISDIETDHNIVYTDLSEYLTPNAIVENENTGATYISLPQAFSAASNGDSLKILENVVLYDTSQNVTIPSGKTLILNLYQSIYEDAGTAITNNGTLTVKGSGRFYSGSYDAFNNTGTLNLDDDNFNYYKNYNIASYSGLKIEGNITNSGTLNIENAAVNTISNSGTLVVDDGVLLDKISNSGSITINDGFVDTDEFIENTYVFGASPSIVVNDGKFVVGSSSTSSYAIPFNIDNGSLTINDGTFITKGNYYLISNSKNTQVLGGTYEWYNNNYSNRGGILINQTGGTATITGLTTFKLGLADVSAGTLNINNLTLNGDYYGGITTSGGTTNINNSSFTNGFASRYTDFIEMTGGTVVITNSTLTPSVSGNNIIIDIGSTSNLTIKGNSIVTQATGTPISNSGTFTIGQKDGNYNVSYPHITGVRAVNNTGTMNFYDGILTGHTEAGAYFGSVNDVETDYIVDTSTSGDTVDAFLRLPGENEKVIIFNNINYSNLQDAIDVAPDNATSTMVLYTNYVLPQDIVVPSGKVINLYLNDHTIDNDGHTITGSLNQLNGAPTGASLSKFLSDTFSSKGKLITLIITVIILTTLGIIYFKKRKHN